MSRFRVSNAESFRGNFGVNEDIYKRYQSGDKGPRTSVGAWSDHEPGYAQSVDKRWRETKGNGVDFIGPNERQASQRVRALTRRSAVTAASRYQWSRGGSDGRSFGRRQAAMADRSMNAGSQGSSAAQIAQF